MAKASSGTGRKAGGGLARPVKPSAELAAIVGSDPLPRSQVVSKVWDHIRKNNLQNPNNKREILADDKLKKVFGRGAAPVFRRERDPMTLGSGLHLPHCWRAPGPSFLVLDPYE
jgi:chromatin remodeling complex protein RSC6